MKPIRLATLLALALAACVSPALEESTIEENRIGDESKMDKKLSSEDRIELRGELTDRKRDLEEAHLALRVETLESESSKAKAEFEQRAAERGVAEARDALARYREVEAPMLKDRAQLELDQAASRLEAEEQDLQGILEIYEGEEEARAKSEIIRRNQKSVDFAKQRLDNERRQARLVTEFEVPTEIQNLEWALQEAEWTLRQAKGALELAELKGLKGMQGAQNKIAGLQEKIDRSSKKLGLKVDREGASGEGR